MATWIIFERKSQSCATIFASGDGLAHIIINSKRTCLDKLGQVLFLKF